MLFLHLGNDVLVRVHDIICILDSNAVKSEIMCKLANKKKIYFACENESNNRSIIVTDRQIIISQISTQTLKKRLCQYSVHLSFNSENDVIEV